LFVVSAGVRLLVWQNNKVEMDGVQWVLTHLYKQDARALLSGDLRLFLAGPNPPSDATVLLHPPGYPILLASVYGIAGENEAFRVFQILLVSLSPVLIFLIAAQLFGMRTGIIAGFLAALAPQFAYHSGLMLPDALSVLPILAALYFLVLARDDPRLLFAILCGVSIGVSCWFRSNALFLPMFFAAAVFLWVPKRGRGRFALLLIAAFVLTIAPITIRNYLVFGSVIPLSVGAGTTFIEGLGDYDADGTLEMPTTDEGVMEMDVRRSGRPDYYGFLYAPDGVERDRARMRAALAVVGENPFWYAASVAHRGISTLRMERVPAIAPDRDEHETTSPILYYLNRPLRLMQSTFVTAVFLPLALIGFVLVVFDRERRRTLIILGIVPLYYATVQALIHTEYRYVLATPHMIMIFSAVTLSFFIGKIGGWIMKDQTSTA
jgi:4-amino-4-deoxy-L-arabinose transferase-like glycosyltransferase